MYSSQSLREGVLQCSSSKTCALLDDLQLISGCGVITTTKVRCAMMYDEGFTPHTLFSKHKVELLAEIC